MVVSLPISEGRWVDKQRINLSADSSHWLVRLLRRVGMLFGVDKKMIVFQSVSEINLNRRFAIGRLCMTIDTHNRSGLFQQMVSRVNAPRHIDCFQSESRRVHQLSTDGSAKPLEVSQRAHNRHIGPDQEADRCSRFGKSS